jgi:hypothetical protein
VSVEDDEGAAVERLALAVEEAGACEWGCGRADETVAIGGPAVEIVLACPVHGGLAPRLIGEL